jgi:hypothetical protein
MKTRISLSNKLSNLDLYLPQRGQNLCSPGCNPGNKDYNTKFWRNFCALAKIVTKHDGTQIPMANPFLHKMTTQAECSMNDKL